MTDGIILAADVPSVAEMLRFLKRTGYSYAQVAREAGVAISTVSRLERGAGVRTPELYTTIVRLYVRRRQELQSLMTPQTEVTL